MRDLHLILWIALLSASSVDLFGGTGPFVLTPFLAFSPIVFGVEVVRRISGGGVVRVHRHLPGFFLAVFALLGVLLLSTFASYDLPNATRRFALLFVQVVFALVVAGGVAARPDAEVILRRGAFVGLGLCLVVNVLQLVAFIFDPAWISSVFPVVDLYPGQYYGILPRFTGVSHDPNHGGIVILVYMALLLTFGTPSRLRTFLLALGAVSILLTLSRAAVLAGAVFWGVRLVQAGRISITARGIATGAAFALCALATSFLFPEGVEAAGEILGILGNRLTSSEGSSSEHLLLLARGWEVGTENLKHFFLGIGYGNAYLVVQDISGGSRYGNFHSLFLTLFAEAGVVAAILGAWLFLNPLVRSWSYRPLVAALLVFNLFQQLHADPSMWMALFLAWTRVGEPDPFAEAPREATPVGEGTFQTGAGRAGFATGELA